MSSPGLQSRYSITNLPLIGKRKKECVLFTHTNQFFEWWKHTIFCTNNVDLERFICDDAFEDNHNSEQPIERYSERFFDLTNTRAPIWSSYHIGALLATGEPRVMCKSCNQALTHPCVKNAGTSAMLKHLTSSRCQQAVRSHAEALQPDVLSYQPAELVRNIICASGLY